VAYRQRQSNNISLAAASRRIRREIAKRLIQAVAREAKVKAKEEENQAGMRRNGGGSWRGIIINQHRRHGGINISVAAIHLCIGIASRKPTSRGKPYIGVASKAGGRKRNVSGEGERVACVAASSAQKVMASSAKAWHQRK